MLHDEQLLKVQFCLNLETNSSGCKLVQLLLRRSLGLNMHMTKRAIAQDGMQDYTIEPALCLQALSQQQEHEIRQLLTLHSALTNCASSHVLEKISPNSHLVVLC